MLLQQRPDSYKSNCSGTRRLGSSRRVVPPTAISPALGPPSGSCGEAAPAPCRSPDCKRQSGAPWCDLEAIAPTQVYSVLATQVSGSASSSSASLPGYRYTMHLFIVRSPHGYLGNVCTTDPFTKTIGAAVHFITFKEEMKLAQPPVHSDLCGTMGGGATYPADPHPEGGPQRSQSQGVIKSLLKHSGFDSEYYSQDSYYLRRAVSPDFTALRPAIAGTGVNRVPKNFKPHFIKELTTSHRPIS